MTEQATAHFFEVVAGGRVNTPEEWHAYLEAFHAALPHANELFTLLRTLAGETSYAMLATAAAQTGARHILDVGCGDGNLIDDLLEFVPEATNVAGVDCSEAEIKIARRRFDGVSRLQLAVADARHLPFEDASFDVVLAHQFLNLFPNIHPLLGEVARVLKPGGDLIFVANRGWRKDQTAVWMVLNKAAMDVLKQLHPKFVWPHMGDMRIYSEEGIPEIFSESPAFDPSTLSMEHFSTSALMTPQQLSAIYNRLYLFGTIPEKRLILAAVECRAEEIAMRNGLVEIELPFRLVHIKKR